MTKPTDDGGSGRGVFYLHRFGSVEYDSRRRELRVAGLVVDVQPIPLSLLERLLATPGELVEKDRIVAAVWGRATTDAVINNAVSKLRNALGDDNATRIVTVPRRGYRLDGEVNRVAIGQRPHEALDLRPGDPVPGREALRLVRRLECSLAHDTWLARHPRSGEQRVFKFALDADRLADLKREVTLYRLLRESLDDCSHLAAVHDWNFVQPPCWIEYQAAGRSLADWADETVDGHTRLRAMDLSERLELFLVLVGAVAACHAVGVLHTDLKPANVLVEDRPEGGLQLRLTDFGAGRLLQPERLAELQITRLGMTVAADDSQVGTPIYMAPELQLGQSPTMAADVYALGLMLFQFAVGDLRSAMASGWERLVPDEVLRADIAGATDLDPKHRLQSAAALLDRLHALQARRLQLEQDRLAERQAVATREALARARARRPWIVAAAAALIVGSATSLLLYDRQRRVAEALAQQAEISEALNLLLREDLIGAANPAEHGRSDITVADALTAAAGRIEQRFAERAPALRGRLHVAMQTSLSELSRTRESVTAGRHAIAALEQAEADPVTLAPVRMRLAEDLALQSELDEARAVLARVENDLGPPGQQPPELRARWLYAQSWVTAGDWSMQESTRQLQEAAALMEAMPDRDTRLQDEIDLSLADNLVHIGRAAEGERRFRQLYDRQVGRFGRDHVRPLNALVGLARAIDVQGRPEEARGLFAEAAAGLASRLGEGHRKTLMARALAATALLRGGDFAAAVVELERAYAGFVALTGAASSTTIVVQTNLGVALHRYGQLRRAQAVLADALTQARSFLDEPAPQVQEIRYALADCRLDTGVTEGVAALLDGLDPAVLEIGHHEPDWPAQLDFQRGRLALASGRPAEAQALLTRAAGGLAAHGRIPPARARELAEVAGRRQAAR